MKELSPLTLAETLDNRYAAVLKGVQERADKVSKLAAGVSIIGTLAIQLSFRDPLFTIGIGATSLLLIGGSRVMYLRFLNDTITDLIGKDVAKDVVAATRNRLSDTNPPDGEGLGSKPPGGPPSTPDAPAPVPSPIIPPPGQLGAETAEKVPTLF